MAVEVGAGGVLDRLGQVAPNDRRGVVGDRLEHPDDDGDPGQQQQLGPAVDTEPVGHQRLVAPDDHVDRDTDQQLGEHVEELVEHRQDGADDHRPMIRLGEVPQPAEGWEPLGATPGEVSPG